MRSLLFALIAGACATAAAAEPLYLRIRPNDRPPEANGTAWSPADDAAAARARALREAVWARSDRRARIAIASVCTGCLTPLAAAPAGARVTAAPDVTTTGSIDEPSAPPPSSPTAGDP